MIFSYRVKKDKQSSTRSITPTCSFLLYSIRQLQNTTSLVKNTNWRCEITTCTRGIALAKHVGEESLYLFDNSDTPRQLLQSVLLSLLYVGTNSINEREESVVNQQN